MGSAELDAAIKNYRSSYLRACAVRQIAPALGRIAALLADMLWHGVRAEDASASRYDGRSWGDETERELINDVAAWRSSHF